MAKITIRFIKPWGLHNAGEVVAVDSPVAVLLVQSGRAALEQGEPGKIETRTAQQTEAKLMPVSGRQHRGRR